MATAPSEQTADGLIPVVEIFGPTVQGEGALAGLPTHFIRIGNCDYRCSWCDSMYAVDPELVATHAERLNVVQIRDRVQKLDEGPSWVTISGGNPAIHDLAGLIEELSNVCAFYTTVETQGSYWRDWLADLDHLTISPKPPSSGMATPERTERVHAFMEKAYTYLPERRRSIKIVVFDDFDLAWAKAFFRSYEDDWEQKYLSIGTARPPSPDEPPFGIGGSVRTDICESLARLYEKAAVDPALAGVRVLPQLHVLAWGHARGV